MAAPIDLRNDFDSVSLRRLAKRTRDATQKEFLIQIVQEDLPMSDHYWLSETQLDRLKPFFPRSHGVPTCRLLAFRNTARPPMGLKPFFATLVPPSIRPVGTWRSNVSSWRCRHDRRSQFMRDNWLSNRILAALFTC